MLVGKISFPCDLVFFMIFESQLRVAKQSVLKLDQLHFYLYKFTYVPL